MPDFTAHNIALPDGSRTMPAVAGLLTESPWLHASARVLATVFPYGPAGRSIIDLGCLEGGYTLEFARLGMRALGVEVRQSNIDNCRLVQRAFPNLDLHFAQDDVWNVERYGAFDVAFCCGLLYHLDRPFEFLKRLGGMTRYAIILNTHVALPSASEVPPLLSPMTDHEGQPGRWYTEYDPAMMDRQALEGARWTSWSNHSSFWPTQAALLQTLRELGFDMVFEQGDWLAPDIRAGTANPFYDTLGRRMLVGIRTGRAGRGLVGALRARLRHRLQKVPASWVAPGPAAGR